MEEIVQSPAPRALFGAGTLVGAGLLERLQFYWGDFLLSYELLLVTILWFLEIIFVFATGIRVRQLAPGDLCRISTRWLLWVAILFVAYSLGHTDALFVPLGHIVGMAVILTQSIYVVRGAARLAPDNPQAQKFVDVFESRLEKRLQQLIDGLLVTQETVDQTRALAEELKTQKKTLEDALARLEATWPNSTR